MRDLPRQLHAALLCFDTLDTDGTEGSVLVTLAIPPFRHALVPMLFSSRFTGISDDQVPIGGSVTSKGMSLVIAASDLLPPLAYLLPSRTLPTPLAS